MFLPRQRNQQSREIVARRWHVVSRLTSGDLNLRPLRPQVDAGRGLDQIGNMGPADSRRSLQEIQLPVATLNELAVRHAAHHSERVQALAR